jgi:L-threonylcarbamoyladenylate synthase
VSANDRGGPREKITPPGTGKEEKGVITNDPMLDKIHHLNNLARVLLNGGIAAYPSDTVLGLGCLPRHSHSVKRLLRIKQRSSDKRGLILLAAHRQQLESMVLWPEENDWLIRAHESAPTTYIVRSRGFYPLVYDATNNTQAIRITTNPWISRLCSRVGAVISTSANYSGSSVASTLDEVRAIFGPQIDYYCDWPSAGAATRPSRIYNTLTKQVIRE